MTNRSRAPNRRSSLETVSDPIALSAARIGNRTYESIFNTYHSDPLLLQTINLSGLFFAFFTLLTDTPDGWIVLAL